MQNNGSIEAIITAGVTDGIGGYKITKHDLGSIELGNNQKGVIVSSELWKQITTLSLDKVANILKDLYEKPTN